MRKDKPFYFSNNKLTSTDLNKKKTILIYHGWGSSIKNYRELAHSLAALGFQVGVPELIFHDNRDKLANHYTVKATQEFFWKTIFKSIDEVDNLCSELKIKTEDTILLGISMGGFIANGIYANDQKFAGMININGSGSFLLSERIFRERDNRPTLSYREIDTLTYYDPISKNRGVAPILLMHGEKDEIVSIKGQEDYFETITKKYGETNLVFQKYSEINHVVSEEMEVQLFKWLQEKFIYSQSTEKGLSDTY